MQPRRPHRLRIESPRKIGSGGQPSAAAEPGLVRVSKRMAALGLCSRREADEWIAKGWVRVDGERITELGTRTLPEQRITIDRQASVEQARRVTILLNKPIGYVSGQAEDGYKPASVLIGSASHWADDPSGTKFERNHLRGLAPAGRLDIDSTGLLVLTQDGRVARQLIGADSGIEKEYLVRVSGRLSAADLALLNHGLSLDGVPLKPAAVSWLNADQLRFVLKEGKKRQVRRMCELVGLTVLGLKRVRIGRVMLGHLPSGQWRYLGADESF
jgi:23S rRNA pseudouridine2604 synthase